MIADATQMFFLEAYEMLTTERDSPGELSDTGYTWEAMLVRRARTKTRDMLDRENPGYGPGGNSQPRLVTLRDKSSQSYDEINPGK